MGQEYLIDTNAVIDYLGDNLPEKGLTLMDTISPQISVISRVELLGWYHAPSDELQKLDIFVKEDCIFPFEEPIILKTIELRQKYKLKTPDAIIAATCLVYNFTLITRNTKDFKNIQGLEVFNPYEG
jgi:predicted nucleic acid-binding protein